MQRAGQVRMRVLPRSPHETILEHFGRARVAIGVNSTDGVPNAMLEAMTMGAFPVQSDTESTAEWITDGRNGLLVHSDDPADIAHAIRRALTDDVLVERAAELNAQLVTQRLDISVIKPRVLEMYQTIGEAEPGTDR
jgi:glycosyltransferase involved in cell wall biosynthesis